MPESLRWRARDSVTAAALFLATAAFTIWQNTRVAVLWDLSYLLDSAWRFSLGQLPYRDIPFAHAPLTFLLHTAIIKLFGRVYWPHIAFAALESGWAILLTWRILLRLSRPRERAFQFATVLAAPLIVLGIYAVYPHPIYDSDAVLAVLLALYLLQRAEESGSAALSAWAGAACVLPLFFKQNIGLAFLAGIAVYLVLAMILCRRAGRKPAAPGWVAAGVAAAAALAIIVLQFSVGVKQYLYWTVTFAAQRRLPGLPLLLADYRQPMLLWSLPAAVAGVSLLRLRERGRLLRMAAFALLAAPFLWTAVSFAINTDAEDRADQLLSLWPHLLVLAAALAIWNLRPGSLRDRPLFPAVLPMMLLATIHGVFLSQQLWGSTYAVWPLLMLLVAGLLATVRELERWMAIVISATLMLCGGVYSGSLERLNYIHLDGQIAHATLPPLRGMSTPGPFLPEFEGLVRFADGEIPAGDGVLLIPGELPFYFATGRKPQFPILLVDLATDPYSPQQMLEQARSLGIRWLIVSRNPQLAGPPHPALDEIIRTVEQGFVPYRTLPGYEVYTRK
jgi:hypothetical protein